MTLRRNFIKIVNHSFTVAWLITQNNGTSVELSVIKLMQMASQIGYIVMYRLDIRKANNKQPLSYGSRIISL